MGFAERRVPSLLLATAVATICLLSGGDAFKVLQLTDFHYDPDYAIQGDTKQACHAFANGTRPNGTVDLGQYGDFACDSPNPLVELAISEAARLSDGPELVLWTGDSVPHIDGYNQSYVVSGLSHVTDLLNRTFQSNAIVVPVFGNHDYSPANDFSGNSSLYSDIWNNAGWRHWLGDYNARTFLRGGYYVLPHRNGSLDILVLNTNLYYSSNTAYQNASDSERADPAGQLAWITETLTNTESKQNRALIVAHIAPGAFERTPNMTWFRPEVSAKFNSILRRFSGTIAGFIAGHHHTDTFHVVYETEDGGYPVAALLMAPAVTPWFSTLPGAGSNNPAFRVYDFREDDFQITDYRTFYINLDDLNAGKTKNFSLLYSFKEAYGIPANRTLNASVFDDLVTGLRSNTTYFENYIKYNSVGWNASLPAGIYRTAQFCSMTRVDLDAYHRCLQGKDDGNGDNTGIGSTIQLSLLIYGLVLMVTIWH